MTTILYLVLILVLSEKTIAREAENDGGSSDDGFVQTLDFSDIFKSPGLTSLASNPIAAAVLKVDKIHYPQLFDTVVSSSIDSLNTQVAPNKNIFSPENFGFSPIASQQFYPSFRSAQLVAQPERPQSNYKPTSIHQKPLQYNIQTLHDPNYKVYKPEDPTQGEEILAALKQNPSVAAYFKPSLTNVEVSHPLDYRKEELTENLNDSDDDNYKTNAYIPGTTRIRRYTDGRRRQKVKKDDDDDDPYDYKSDYTSRPKAFDTDIYSSAYKEEKDPNKEYEYPYSYDSGYDHKEYDRIKELSEKQAAEIKQNPGNCQEVKRDGMTCMVCKDPKTGGNYESCSYVTEPKNNKYAYSKERKFDSNDEPDEPEQQKQENVEESKKPVRYEESKEDQKPVKEFEQLREQPEKANTDDDKYKAYYVHTSKPHANTHAALKSSEEKDSEENSDSLRKPYNYKAAIPGFYTNNEQKKDVEDVLAEFKKKDRSSCKKVHKNGMTCFQCIDKTGLKHEECMFVSESAPKRSHLAYQELKEFTSKPATLESGSEAAAESQIVTTSATPIQKSAALVLPKNGYGKKLKRKKVDNQSVAAASTVAKTASPTPAPSALGNKQQLRSRKAKRSENSKSLPITDETNLAPPEEFAGANSKGAFWAETIPRYSRTLGVTLPEFMLSRSEHEISFDEAVAGA